MMQRGSNWWTFCRIGGLPIIQQSIEARAPGSDIDTLLAQLNGPADPAAGERVFFHTKGPGCYRCHQVQGRGSRAGPDLTTLPAGIDRRRLIESIVAPSKEIAPAVRRLCCRPERWDHIHWHSARAVAGGRVDLRRFGRPTESR